jgi:DNA-binding NarL/FixJ family response regulator
LIVDDYPEVRDRLKVGFEISGLDVVGEAASAGTAVDLAKGPGPRATILDSMP